MNQRGVDMNMEPESISTSDCSIHIIEKPMELIADCNDKVEELYNGTERFRMDQSYLNLMELKQNSKSNHIINSKSDLIKLTTMDEKDLIKSPESKINEDAPATKIEVM